jgi:hypothetical protein
MALLVIIPFRHVAAQAPTPSPSDISVLRELQSQLISWFTGLSSQFDSLAAAEDRRKLKNQLIDLDKAIYDLEFNGRYLVEALSRQPLLEDEVRRGIVDTRQSLNTVRERLHTVGLSLRAQYRAGGAGAEQLIADATAKRSMWLSDVEAALQQHRIPPALINDGRGVLAMQATASRTLLLVIEKM